MGGARPKAVVCNEMGTMYMAKFPSIKDDYDVVVIDTPPALSIVTINALTAADSLIIPVQADLFSKFHITMPNMTHNTYDLLELINKTIEPYAINPLEGNVDMATRIIMKQIPDNIVDEDECDCKVSHKF